MAQRQHRSGLESLTNFGSNLRLSVRSSIAVAMTMPTWQPIVASKQRICGMLSSEENSGYGELLSLIANVSASRSNVVFRAAFV
jgi:hypothetical protein